MMLRIFKVTVVLLVALFSICGLAFLFAGFMTTLRTPIGAGGGIGTGSGGFSIGFLRLIAVAVIVLAVGLFGLTRLSRFLK